MSNRKIDPKHLIQDEATLRAMFPATHDLAIQKCLSALDLHARAFIQRAPFLCIGTQDAEGKADVSPRGDPAGFVQILDDQTIAIPDRPGNNRLDTLSNIVANPKIGLLFLIPGFDETLRINGTACLTTDPDLLRPMAVNDRPPKLAIVVDIQSVFLHCAKAFRRAKLWDPDAIQDRKEMPSLVQMIMEQSTGAPEDPKQQAALDAALEESYQRSMY